jgi:hypothetical protein
MICYLPNVSEAATQIISPAIGLPVSVEQMNSIRADQLTKT